MQLEVQRTEFELTKKGSELDARKGELESNRASTVEGEARLASLTPEIRDFAAKCPAETRVLAEAGAITISPELAERDVRETRQRLELFKSQGPIPEATIREEEKLIRRNIEELEKHVAARQGEADEAKLELDQCRGDYLQVIGSTLHDYRRRAYGLAGRPKCSTRLDGSRNPQGRQIKMPTRSRSASRHPSGSDASSRYSARRYT